MAIYGNLEEAGLPDVLQLLSLGRKSGCLSVVDGEMHGEIYLSGGKVTYATVSGRAERFGEMLVKNGLISRGQLQVAVEAQARAPKRQLGHILADSGQIDRADLERFVRLQVEEAIYFLFARRQGEFSFLSEKRTSHQALAEPLDPEGLLLEGARRVDEWSQIQRKIPSFDLVYRRTKDTHTATVSAELTDAQRRILPLLDGTRDVAGLVDATGMGEFEVGKALYGLIMAGFAQLVDRRVAARHLDYRDLLAWVVREAEYADPVRRKEAGRHIVDCPTCADRLRKIQVRRTEGSGVTAASVATTLAAAPAPAVPPRPPRASPVSVPTESRIAAAAPQPERRVGDRRTRERRTGFDRRQGDRRGGLDRRLAVDPAWSMAHAERRRGPRRAEERRSTHGGDRRSGQVDKRGSEPPAPAAPASRRGGNGGRITEPRLIQRLDGQERDWPLRTNLPAPALVETAAAEAPAAAGLVETAAVEEEMVAAEEAAEAEVPAATTRESVPGLSREIEWLVTPAESTEMLRASRASRRAAGAAPAPHPAPRPEARQAEAPRAPAVPPRPIPPSDAGRLPVPESRRGPVVPGHLTWGDAEARPREAGLGRGPFPALDLRALPLRSIAVGSVIVLLGIAGYGAGKFARHGGAARTERPAAAAPSVSADAPQPATGRSGAPGTRPTRQVAETQRTPTGVPAVPGPNAPAPRQTGPAALPATRQAGVATVAPAPQRIAAPTAATLRGVVRGPDGAAIPGARVSVRGTSLATVADASGAFELAGVPDGAVVVQASADGFVAANADARARAGATVNADLTLARVPAAASAPAAPAPAAPAAPAPVAGEPDRELSEGGWNVVSRADALAALGGTLGAIGGLPIESIAKSTAGARQRVRVAQIADGGQRIVLIETRAGAAVRGDEGPAHVTALRVLPASEAYPFSTGTASFGNILITAKSGASADLLRSLLGRLAEVSQ